MKLPQTFVPNKGLEEKIKELLEYESRIKYDPNNVSCLYKSCNRFIEEVKTDDLKIMYGKSKRLIEKLQINYTTHDIEALSRRIGKLNTPWKVYISNLGIYFSALINEIIAEKDRIELTLKKELDGLGLYLEIGELVVKGNLGSFTGSFMKGGKMTVAGNVNKYAGYSMEDGIIIVKGNTGDHLGYNMPGGEIRVQGKILDIERITCKGTIYHKDKRVWPI